MAGKYKKARQSSRSIKSSGHLTESPQHFKALAIQSASSISDSHHQKFDSDYSVRSSRSRSPLPGTCASSVTSQAYSTTSHSRSRSKKKKGARKFTKKHRPDYSVSPTRSSTSQRRRQHSDTSDTNTGTADGLWNSCTSLDSQRSRRQSKPRRDKASDKQVRSPIKLRSLRSSSKTSSTRVTVTCDDEIEKATQSSKGRRKEKKPVSDSKRKGASNDQLKFSVPTSPTRKRHKSCKIENQFAQRRRSKSKSLKVATGSCASTTRREGRLSTESGVGQSYSGFGAMSSSAPGGSSEGGGGPGEGFHHNHHGSIIFGGAGGPGLTFHGGAQGTRSSTSTRGSSSTINPPSPQSSSLMVAASNQAVYAGGSSSSSSQQQLLSHLGLQPASSTSVAGPSSTEGGASSSVTVSLAGGGPFDLSSRGFLSARSGQEALEYTLHGHEEVDMSRIQSLLEARGMASSIFSSSRMHQVAQQMVGHNLSNNVNQRIVQLQQAADDRSTQFTIIQDINQNLLMGYEDNLASIHVKQLVSCILEILRAADLDELKSLGCNVLTHMMDVLPRSSDAVVPAIPLLLETMDNSSLMDIFERVINVLEQVSRRHGRSVLQHGGITTVMRFFDFLTAAQQRTTLTLVSNCFLSLTKDDFSLIVDSLPGLTERIKQPDAKCVEKVCTCFARLVSAYQTDETLLKQIAANNLFPNLQHLLMTSPPILSGVQEVIHMLATMCANCSDLAVVLIKQNIAETLRFILIGESSPDKAVGVSHAIGNRRQEETYEIVNLIAELMPRLPVDGMFSINQLLYPTRQSFTWMWQNDAGNWTAYSPDICRLLDEARRSGEEETLISEGSNRYLVHFASMYQQNMETSVTRRVQALRPSEAAQAEVRPNSGDVEGKCDSRTLIFQDLSDGGVDVAAVIRTLFPLLLDVYSESSSSNVKYKCLEAMLRMICPAPENILECVLSQGSIFSSLAAMMASSDWRVVVGSLQMSLVLLRKLPRVFVVYFKKEGVLFQLDRIVEDRHPLLASPSTSVSPLMSTSAAAVLTSTRHLSLTPSPDAAPASSSSSSPLHQTPGTSGGSLSSVRLTDMFRRRQSKNSKSRRATKDEHLYTVGSSSSVAGLTSRIDSSMDTSQPIASRDSPMTSSMTLDRSSSGGMVSRRLAILSHLNPARWTRSSTSSGTSNCNTSTTPRHHITKSIRGRGSSNLGVPTTLSGPSRDQQVSQWITEYSRHLRRLFDTISTPSPMDASSPIGSDTAHSSSLSSPTPVINDVLPTLEALSTQLASSVSKTGSSSSGCSVQETRALRHLAKLFTDGVDLSPFELQHSGLVQNLLNYLTEEEHREMRLRTFIKIFLKRTCSVEESRRRLDTIQPPPPSPPLSAIVHRLIACLHQQEQFQVRASLDATHHHSASALYHSHYRGGGSHAPISQQLSYLSMLAGGSSLGGGAGSTSDATGHPLFMGLNSSGVLQFSLPSSSSLARTQGEVKTRVRPGEIELRLVRHPLAGPETPHLSTTVVRVDPLTTVQEVEMLILRRGVMRSSRGEVHSSDSSDSGDDDDTSHGDASQDTETIDVSMASITLTTRGSRSRPSGTAPGSSTGRKRRDDSGPLVANWPRRRGGKIKADQQGLQLKISVNNHTLHSDMPMYQAIKQYSHAVQETNIDMDNEEQVNHSIWANQHTVHFQLTEAASSTTPLPAHSPQAGSSTGEGRTAGRRARTDAASEGGNKRRRKDELWTDGQVPSQPPALLSYMTRDLPIPSDAKITDPSMTTLALLRVLSAVNRHWYTLDSALDPYSVLPQSDFLSAKLSVKANRQLQDMFSVLAGNLPNWLIQLMTTCAFLFPFDTRQNFFYAYHFDRDRTILRLQETTSSESESSERLSVQMKRYKVTVSRGDKLLKHAEKIFSDLGKSKAMLEIAFEGEVGFGQGPTLEFYTVVSRELMRSDLGLWHGDLSSPGSGIGGTNFDYVVPPAPGLYPRPLARNARLSTVREVKNKFTFLGRLMARSLLDTRQLDLPLSPVLFKWLLGQQDSITLADLHLVDPNLARHTRDLWALVERKRTIDRDPSNHREQAIAELGIDDLYLVFVIPGYKVELMKNGMDTAVTADNLELYLRLLSHWMLVEGVHRQMTALVDGFESVLSRSHLASLFTPDELEWLFCGRSGTMTGSSTDWEVKTLMEACCCDHGYTINSRSIGHLFAIVAEFSEQERRLFLQFVTGSPRLPVGGFRALKPPLKIVLKRENCENPDNHLPSVMTCQNYLKLPDYSTKELMKAKLLLAIREGQLAFHLS